MTARLSPGTLNASSLCSMVNFTSRSSLYCSTVRTFDSTSRWIASEQASSAKMGNLPIGFLSTDKSEENWLTSQPYIYWASRLRGRADRGSRMLSREFQARRLNLTLESRTPNFPKQTLLFDENKSNKSWNRGSRASSDFWLFALRLPAVWGHPIIQGRNHDTGLLLVVFRPSRSCLNRVPIKVPQKTGHGSLVSVSWQICDSCEFVAQFLFGPRRSRFS